MRRTLALLPLFAALAVPSIANADGIIVKREPGLDRTERLAVRADADVTLVDTLTLPDTEVVAPQPGQTADAALAQLNADPDVVYAEPNVTVTLQSNDTWYSQLWSLDTVSGPAAWAHTRGAGATVAVVDTGVDLTHPDLAGQFASNPGERGDGKESNGIDDDHDGYVDDWQGWDFVNHDNTIETQGNSHGTHVAGTIAALADNNLGVAGVAPEAKILPVKVFGGPGADASLDTIAEAFDYAGKLGVPVVNASLGGLGTSATIDAAIAKHPQTLYVVAAGNNNGANAANYTPCNADDPNVVCVGATDIQDRPANFSNVGATAVDLFAPGQGIYSTLPGGSYGWMNGTSMATPHVAGAVALLAAAQPYTTSAQRKTALMGSVDAVSALSGLAVTGGRLNTSAAVDALPAATPPPSPTPTPTEPPTPAPPPVETPAPAPPVATPVPVTPTPAPLPVVSAVKVSGKKLTYTVSAGTKVSFSVLRQGCPAKRGCASGPLAHWSQTSKAGANTLTVGRKMGGRKLRPGRYTLVLTTAGGSRSVAIRVR